MAKYVAEDTSIAAVAEAIREKGGTAEMLTFPDDFVSAVNKLNNCRVYTGENTETVVGYDKYIVLAKDDFLKEHRNDESLFVRVKFDVEAEPYTVVEAWAFNSLKIFPYRDLYYQYTLRYGSDGNENSNRIGVAINTDSPEGVGCVQITEDGELRIYSRSTTNYTIRPGTYTAKVEW